MAIPALRAAFEQARESANMGLLRQTLPELQRLESLPVFDELRLKKVNDVYDGLVVFQYDAVAPQLFPAVRQRLIDAGMAGRHQMLHTKLDNEGQPNERYNVTMGFYGGSLQISVDVYRNSPTE